MNILEQIKCIAHDDFSICSLNTKSFYHGLIMDYYYYYSQRNFIKVLMIFTTNMPNYAVSIRKKISL